MNRFIILGLFCLALGTIGCSSSSSGTGGGGGGGKASIVGTWEMKMMSEDPLGKEGKIEITSTLELTADGKAKLVTTGHGEKEEESGTYKLEGDQLTLSGKKDGKDDIETLTVKELTDSKLVLVTSKALDPKDAEMTFTKKK